MQVSVDAERRVSIGLNADCSIIPSAAAAAAWTKSRKNQAQVITFCGHVKPT